MAEKGYKIEDFDRVLVVEGHGDLFFFAEILKAEGKPRDYAFIKSLGGNSILKTWLETFINAGLLDTKVAIGFIFDADENPAGKRASLENLLSKLIGQAVVDGKWTRGKPNIGLLIVPGGNVPGKIETLVWNSWANDPANMQQKECVLRYVDCMKAAGQEAHSPAKGLIGALLAIRADEDPRLGPGTRENVFNLNRPELNQLREFLSGF